jgi:ABC-2 type transport system ATP-binding protein
VSHADPTAISIKVADAPAAAGVLGALTQASIPLSNFSLGTPSLDDVFFALTGKPPEEKAPAEKAAAGEVAQ